MLGHLFPLELVEDEPREAPCACEQAASPAVRGVPHELVHRDLRSAHQLPHAAARGARARARACAQLASALGTASTAIPISESENINL